MRVENRARLPEKGKSHEALAEDGEGYQSSTPQLNTALTLVVYRPRGQSASHNRSCACAAPAVDHPARVWESE